MNVIQRLILKTLRKQHVDPTIVVLTDDKKYTSYNLREEEDRLRIYKDPNVIGVLWRPLNTNANAGWKGEVALPEELFGERTVKIHNGHKEITSLIRDLMTARDRAVIEEKAMRQGAPQKWLEGELSKLDWFAEMSPDKDKIAAKKAHLNRIKEVAVTLPLPVAKSIWKKNRPRDDFPYPWGEDHPKPKPKPDPNPPSYIYVVYTYQSDGGTLSYFGTDFDKAFLHQSDAEAYVNDKYVNPSINDPEASPYTFQGSDIDGIGRWYQDQHGDWSEVIIKRTPLWDNAQQALSYIP